MLTAAICGTPLCTLHCALGALKCCCDAAVATSSYFCTAVGCSWLPQGEVRRLQDLGSIDGIYPVCRARSSWCRYFSQGPCGRKEQPSLLPKSMCSPNQCEGRKEVTLSGRKALGIMYLVAQPHWHTKIRPPSGEKLPSRQTNPLSGGAQVTQTQDTIINKLFNNGL
jgi:hypothetical protein